MGDALWVPGTGVSYTADESRKLLYGIYTPGVISGLTLATGSGFNVNVSAGFAAVPDSSGTGMYLASLDTTTPRLISANATSSIYLVVDPVTATCTLSSGSVPTNPYLTIGQGTAGALNTTSVSTTGRSTADFRSTAGLFVKKAGDSISGPLTTTALTVSTSLVVNGTAQLVQGARLGAAATPTKRLYLRMLRTTAQSIPDSSTTNVWTTLTGFTSSPNTNDYGGTVVDLAAGKLIAPVSGSYLVGGNATFANTAADKGKRRARIVMYDPANTLIWNIEMPRLSSSEVTDNDHVVFNAAVSMGAGSYLLFQVQQGQGTALSINPAGQGLNGEGTWVSLSLLQPF